MIKVELYELDIIFIASALRTVKAINQVAVELNLPNARVAEFKVKRAEEIIKIIEAE